MGWLFFSSVGLTGFRLHIRAPMKAKAFMGKGRMTEAEVAADTECSQELTFGHSDAVPPRAPHFDLKSKDLGSFFVSENFLSKFIFRRFSCPFDKGPISNVFLTLF